MRYAYLTLTVKIATFIHSVRQIKKHWAKTILVVYGIGAIGVLLVILLRPTEAAWDTATSCAGENPDQKHWECIRKLGVASVPLLLKEARAEGPFRSDIVVALASIGPEAVPALVSGFRD